MILKDDNGKELPKKVQDRVNNFINNLSKINWFDPGENLKKSEVDKQAKFTMKCFWFEANIEYRKLETKEDRECAGTLIKSTAWNSARITTSISSWDSAITSAWASAWGSTCVSAWNSSLGSYWDHGKVSGEACMEILLQDDKYFKEKYPNWAFRQLFKIWEMGLYPLWIIKENNKFVIYADPKAKNLFE